jgi:hypothetical protein
MAGGPGRLFPVHWIVSRLVKMLHVREQSRKNEFPLQVVRIFVKPELRRFGGFVKKLEGPCGEAIV